MSKHAEFYRPLPPIPLARQVEALERLIIYAGVAGSPYGRVIEKGAILDEDDPAVKQSPQHFRRPAGPILTREEVT